MASFGDFRGIFQVGNWSCPEFSFERFLKRQRSFEANRFGNSAERFLSLQKPTTGFVQTQFWTKSRGGSPKMLLKTLLK